LTSWGFNLYPARANPLCAAQCKKSEKKERKKSKPTKHVIVKILIIKDEKQTM